MKGPLLRPCEPSGYLGTYCINIFGAFVVAFIAVIANDASLAEEYTKEQCVVPFHKEDRLRCLGCIGFTDLKSCRIHL